MVRPSLLLVPGMHLVLGSRLQTTETLPEPLLLVPNMGITTRLHRQCLALTQSMMLPQEVGTDWNLLIQKELG